MKLHINKISETKENEKQYNTRYNDAKKRSEQKSLLKGSFF